MPDAGRPGLLAGVACVIAGVTLFAVQDAAGKLLAESQSVVQIVWARYVFALPVLLLATPRRAWAGLLRVSRPGLQAARALLPVLASFAIVLGLIFLPLAEVTVLTFASPLLVAALSAPILGERVSLRDWLGILLGFVGIVILVRPGTDAFAWASIFPLACAAFFALFQLTTRLVGRSDPPTATLAWTLVIGFIVTTILLPLDWRPATPAAWGLMVLTGFCFGGAQYFLIRAYNHAPAALLAPFTYTQIVPATLLGLIVFGTVPDAVAWLGTAIVIGAGLMVLRGRI